MVGRGTFSALEIWQTSYLPVFCVWAALVVIVFLLLFGDKLAKPDGHGMFNTILFDFGDTLVDYQLGDLAGQLALIRAFLHEMRGLKRLPIFEANEIPAIARKLNTENTDHSTWPFVERLRSKQFFGPSLAEESAAAIERDICRRVFETAQLVPGALQAVDGLKRLNRKVGIISNLPWGTSSHLWRHEFQRHGFAQDRIDSAICCVDVGFRKPHPAMVLRSIQALDSIPSMTMVVGDRASDVEAAHQAGCTAAHFSRRSGCEGCEADVHLSSLLNLLDLIA